ncbi:MAG: hypothetical protein Q4D56_14255 [Bacteroides sp.]|nr:hypothetical protein [Bacteroides sp.]
MKQTIIAYLQGPRPYREGCALYEAHGNNRMLKAMFRRNPESRLMQETLVEELRKLAGLTEAELKALPRRAATDATTDTTAQAAAAKAAAQAAAEEKLKEASPTVQNVIRFRDRFPFLRSPQCPDVLKVLVADMFTAYDTYLTAYRELVDMPADEGAEYALSVAKTAVENYLEDRTIWDELEHYQQTGTLKGTHPKVAKAVAAQALTGQTDLEVAATRKNAASNVSKWKKKLEAAETDEERTAAQASLDHWTRIREAADEELERRKKN